MEDPGPKGEHRVEEILRTSSLDGVPAKVRTKLDESWELHRPLSKEIGGLLLPNAWRMAVWRERTIAAGSPFGF